MKKTMNMRGLLAASALAAAMALTACGGGGAGGSAGPAGTDAGGSGGTAGNSAGSLKPLGSSTAFVASNITLATVQATYTGEELAAYNAVTTARTTCGFGGLNQNTHLDDATLNHNAYMAQNNVFGHYESAGQPGYTGYLPEMRGIVAGYPSSLTSYGEVLSSATYLPKAGFGLRGTRMLLGAPYHLMGIMQGNRELGISVRSAGQAGSGADYINTDVSWKPRALLAIDFGARQGLPVQHQSSADVLTYPCAGITDTAYMLGNESPNPVPSRNLLTAPIGQPVFVQVLEGQTLVVTSASLIGPGGAVALLPTMTAANDPNTILGNHQAMIIPTAPLTPNTTYNVSITGTNNGTAFSRNFAFTTGNVY